MLLISACYSGVFVHDVMLKPNRIILTAARDDRSSFGCAPQNEYTDWDRCVIDNLPSADTWQSLYGSVSRCVQTRESEGHFTPSIPQGFFGNEVAELKIPSLTRSAIGVAVSQCPVSGDDGYGFSAANAIKVGLDDATGPARERKYLNALRGPAGQRLSFRRVGSTVTADKTILDL